MSLLVTRTAALMTPSSVAGRDPEGPGWAAEVALGEPRDGQWSQGQGLHLGGGNAKDKHSLGENELPTARGQG